VGRRAGCATQPNLSHREKSPAEAFGEGGRVRAPLIRLAALATFSRREKEGMRNPTSPTGRGRRAKARRVRGLRQGGADRLEDAIDVRHDLVVPDSHHAVSACFEPLSSRCIPVPSAGVLATANLDDQFRLLAIEVGDIGTEWSLAPELEASETAVAQVPPKTPLRLGHGPAQTSRRRHRHGPPLIRLASLATFSRGEKGWLRDPT